MLHTKYQGSRTYGFRQEDFFNVFSYYLGFCTPPPPPPTGVTSRLCFSDSITSNELFATCWPSGGGDVWVLQRVEYVTPHFWEKQKYKIKAIKEVFELFKLAKQSCNM